MLNLQGDVVKLVEHTRIGKAYVLTTVAEYTYNAWGEILTATGEMAEINPLRYRGYYYDTETGFYYLQSRYYDPTMHRFINADSYQSTGQGIVGTNMFAYCNNCPIIFKDPSGESLVAITVSITSGGVVAVAITVAGVAIVTYALAELTYGTLEWLWELAEKLGAKIFYDEAVRVAVPATKSFAKSDEETKTNVAAAIESADSKKTHVIFPKILFFSIRKD